MLLRRTAETPGGTTVELRAEREGVEREAVLPEQAEDAHRWLERGKREPSGHPPVGRKRRRRAAGAAAAAALGVGSLLQAIGLIDRSPSPDASRDEDRETAARTGEPVPFPILDQRPEDVVATVDPGGNVDLSPAPPPPPPPPVDPAVSVFQNVQKTWAEPAPGIRHLSIAADGQKVEIAEIDLRSGLYDVRATRPEERGQTTSQFAANTGAVVAINADLFEYGSYHPYGLAVGDGVHWQGTADNPDWLFFACDGSNSCIIDRGATAAPLDPTWTDVVGAQGAALVVDGVPQIRGDHPHGVDRHPRTAIGISDQGKLILLVAAGRSGDAIGMTYDEMAVLMHEMGARDAVNLDGGGSSALVINGQRVSQLPGHGQQERAVSNHLAIVRTS